MNALTSRAAGRLSCRAAVSALFAGALCAPVGAQVITLSENYPSAVIGGMLRMTVQGAPPSAPLILGLGSGTSLWDPPLRLSLGDLYFPPVFVVPMGVANWRGIGGLDLPVPNSPGLKGTMLLAQALDGVGLSLSNAIGVNFGPASVLSSPNPATGGGFGVSVAVGDFRGSPHLDIAVGAAGETVGSVRWAGRVYVFEGPSFTNVTTLQANVPEYLGWFGHALAALDFDGDGKTDLAVGEPKRDSPTVGPDTGRVLVFGHPVQPTSSTALVAPVPQQYDYLGWSLAGADLDQTRGDEVIAGAPHDGGVSSRVLQRVEVFSRSRHLLTLLDPTPGPSTFGRSVAAGDTNADGRPEILVGDRLSNNAGKAGEVHLFRSNGSLVATIRNPYPQGGNFGWTVAIGDLNADSKGDLLVGAPGPARAAYAFFGPSFTNPRPRRLPAFAAGPFSSGGRSVLIADVNGDNRKDALVTANLSRTSSSPALSFYLGPGQKASGFMSPPLPSCMPGGWSLAAGDLNGDGNDEVVAGEVSSGRALIFW